MTGPAPADTSVLELLARRMDGEALQSVADGIVAEAAGDDDEAASARRVADAHADLADRLRHPRPDPCGLDPYEVTRAVRFAVESIWRPDLVSLTISASPEVLHVLVGSHPVWAVDESVDVCLETGPCDAPNEALFFTTWPVESGRPGDEFDGRAWRCYLQPYLHDRGVQLELLG
jgi:hypothetical protein